MWQPRDAPGNQCVKAFTLSRCYGHLVLGIPTGPAGQNSCNFLEKLFSVPFLNGVSTDCDAVICTVLPVLKLEYSQYTFIE